MRALQRPSVELGFPGDPFTLFYDYDQIENQKLTPLTRDQKAKWFERRLRMTHLQPLRRIWKEPVVFDSLLESKLDPAAECSFSVAAMGIMLNVVEALGSFRRPDLSGSDDDERNWRMFLDFLANHMGEWNVNVSYNVSVPKVLWKSFRNGITHGLRIGQVPHADDLWGSLEFRGNFDDRQKRRFERHGQLLRVCPEDFFDDLESAVKDYFGKLYSNSDDLLAKFIDRFNKVYPN